MRALKPAWFHTWIKDLRLFQRQSKASAAGDMSMDESMPRDVLTVGVNISAPSWPFTPTNFDVLYDPQVLQLETTPVDLSNTLSGGLTAVTNAGQARRLASRLRRKPITASSTLINLKFRVVDAPGSSSSLAFSGLMLNEENPAADGKSGKVVVRRWCHNNLMVEKSKVRSSWTSLTRRGSA